MNMAAVLGLFVLLLSGGDSVSRYLPPLHLKSGCTMRLDQVTREERGLFVACGTCRFRVYHPKSMYGLVTVGDAEAALSFVRFFSTRYTAGMAGLGGFVEVRSLADERGIDFYYVKPEVFAARIGKPVVTPYGAGVDGASYLVERVVLFPDQGIYRVRERVSKDGNYELVDQTLVESDASTLGIRYSGLH